ncbi:tankyrase-1-like isoform X1 [Panicum miliaceum]|uniref:Tankyrase-1-like isoform X1 n=1 Tax=Panicum miliaceum TaxID=4540 RepID=A0A3L6PCV0_PANMI|nr:tankyrase-1-like isoform X1 [Panicum miliaceum]
MDWSNVYMTMASCSDWLLTMTPLAKTLLAIPERMNESTRLKCMKLLVKAGADLNSRHPQTPLVIATLKGLTECVEYLLEAGADANIPAKDVGSKPIEFAAESGRRKLVEVDQSDNTDSKVHLKLHDDKAIKHDAVSSKPCPEDEASDKDRKAQLKLKGGKAVEAKDYASALEFYSEKESFSFPLRRRCAEGPQAIS